MRHIEYLTVGEGEVSLAMVPLRSLIDGGSGAPWRLPSLHDVWVEGKPIALSRGLGELRGLNG